MVFIMMKKSTFYGADMPLDYILVPYCNRKYKIFLAAKKSFCKKLVIAAIKNELLVFFILFPHR